MKWHLWWEFKSDENLLARRIIVTFIIKLELGKVKARCLSMKFPFLCCTGLHTSRTHAISLDLVTFKVLHWYAGTYVAHSPVLMVFPSCIVGTIVKIPFEFVITHWAVSTHIHTNCVAWWKVKLHWIMMNWSLNAYKIRWNSNEIESRVRFQ